MLRKAVAGGVESGESSTFEDTVRLAPEHAAQRFEHCELAKGEDGKPVEFGRGAMGVTYKAYHTRKWRGKEAFTRLFSNRAFLRPVGSYRKIRGICIEGKPAGKECRETRWKPVT